MSHKNYYKSTPWKDRKKDYVEAANLFKAETVHVSSEKNLVVFAIQRVVLPLFVGIIVAHHGNPMTWDKDG